MKKNIIRVSILLLIVSSIIVYCFGKEYSIKLNGKLNNIRIEYDERVIECKIRTTKDNIYIDISPIKPGKTKINIYKANTNKKIKKIKVYVHSFNIITINNYLGKCNGGIAFNISFYVIMVLIIVKLIIKYYKDEKSQLYSQKNANTLGLIIFVSITHLFNMFLFIYDYLNGQIQSIEELVISAGNNIFMFLVLLFPIIVTVTILVMISNLILMKKEGKGWKNMLGIIIGGILFISTFITLIYRSSIYSNNLLILMVRYYIIDIIIICIVYFECILIGTIIIGIKAATRIPKFDKDFIIILGCRIKNDGTLTNLLKSRTDRAIEFSDMQKKATGKDIIFVPSGGKGDDEIISEAQAIKNYLMKQGIKEEKIIIEDKSKSTNENIKFSYKIINERQKNAKIAFSTTNYHVLRVGIIASKQNIKIEGIGSKTKAYYWINAFIREYIAVVVSERKKHIKNIAILSILLLILSIITYISMQL